MQGFQNDVQIWFGTYPGFESRTKFVNQVERVTVNFRCDGWPVEIFGQSISVTRQNGFRHMVIEEQLLTLGGKRLMESIIQLKILGFKTEPAFAKLLGLDGDAYEALLKLEDWTDEELRRLLRIWIH
ncbi:DUF4269 domain-containing protein [Paenibacillus polymyxa]|uniref:DUF4269 domain-containing protein n=1 Tax=Paenibacillus polymyxa TaxID=1406 RepID=UPI003B677FF7